jgi:hypothetical protein
MKSLDINYFEDREKLHFVWETVIQKWYFVSDLQTALFTTFLPGKYKYSKKMFLNCNSYKEFYLNLKSIGLLEEFVATFDDGLWNGDPDKVWE